MRAGSSIETGGVGYEIFIPLTTYYRLPSIGSPVSLEIRQIVREDSLLLYGFSDSTEKRAFDLLLGVQHVGPKARARDSVGALARGFGQGDLARRRPSPRRCAGRGRQGGRAHRARAARQDRQAEIRWRSASDSGAGGLHRENGMGTIGDDAVSALVNLAYKPIQAQRAVDSVMARKRRRRIWKP